VREFVPFNREDLDQSIPARFGKQARSDPGRLAVRSPAHELTYGSLDRLSNRIARAILANRGDAEATVALLFQPGAPLVAAILGALKAGKIYVPLDVDDPPGSLSRMLDDSLADLILTDDADLPRALRWATPDRAVISIDALASGVSDDDVGIDLSPERLAYVYYTSGSTGPPKGVVDSHRNVLHNVMRYTNSLRIGPEDRLSLIQRPGFSGSVSSLFCALLNGAAVFPLDLRREGLAGVARRIREERITIFHSVPSIFRHLFHPRHDYPDLRLIRLEGDRAVWKDVDLFRERFRPDCSLVNGLGATETGISRQFFIGTDTPRSTPTLPVGWATEDVEIEVTGDDGSVLPPGQEGEIRVRSPYLAAGYWNRPDATAKAFLPDPAGTGRRTYRSGDLGRMGEDGCLELLGRIDLTARVRGRRVELDVVEGALLALPEIGEAVVGVREEESGEARVVAWFVPRQLDAPSGPSLRRALAGSIPEVSMPSEFVRLDSLPLDGNGKVDRRRLMDSGRELPSAASPYLAPRSRAEQIVAGVWRDVLGLARVGVHDDFLELGGDSLGAMRVINRLQACLGVPVPVEIALRNRTVAQIARALEPLPAEIAGDGHSAR